MLISKSARGSRASAIVLRLGCSIPLPRLACLPFFLYPLPWAFSGWEHLVSGAHGSRLLLADLGQAGASMKISLWWSVAQSLPASDPGWAHKSPRLACGSPTLSPAAPSPAPGPHPASRPGQPRPRHPRGSKYYITTGCAVRDLRQAPGLKFPREGVRLLLPPTLKIQLKKITGKM